MKRLISLALLCLLLCACTAAPAGTTLPPQTTAPTASSAPTVSTPPALSDSFTIHIEDPEAYVYTGPGFAYDISTMIGEAGDYTISEVVEDADGNQWCLLTSGLGWVCQTLPPLAPIYADYAPESFNAYHTYWCGETDYLTSIGFTPAERLTNVTFGLLDWFETESWQMAEDLFTIDSMDPDHPFLAQVVFWGDLTTYGISFTDASGNARHYAISISGKDGSVVCTEYVPE